MKQFKCLICGKIHEKPDNVIISSCECGGKTEVVSEKNT